MTGLCGEVIRACGQEMTCYDGAGTWLCAGPAVIQPVTEDGWQQLGGELGRWDTGKYRGWADPALTPVEGGWVKWCGGRYEVLSVRPVRAFGEITHLWLSLRRAGEVEP